MALVVPGSGAITFSTLATVFGLSAPYKLSDLRKGGSYVPNTSDNANVKTTTSNMNVSDYRNSTVEYTLTLSSNSTNYHLYNSFVALYTSFAIARKYVKLTINSGITVGSNSTGSPALDVGQFPTGTTISVVNNGNVYGAAGSAGNGGTVFNAAVGAAGGATNGGSGGDAIKANYLNQTVTITNNGTVYGGGGGGGGGGKGAVGESIPADGPYRNDNYSVYGVAVNSPSVANIGSITWRWNGVNVGTSVFQSTFNQYYLGSLTGYNRIGDTAWMAIFYIGRNAVSGADGGNGGNGSSGRGNNYFSALTGISGSVSAGNGTTGGSGGNGGDWGAAGSAGTGTNPGAGGSAGRYLLKGSATVTITGGTIVGLLA